LDLRCDKCHEPIYKEHEGFILPKNCKCGREEIERLNEQDRLEKIKEDQRKLDKLKQFSMMDSQFYDCTFENYKVDEDNEKLYKLALKYCDHWEEMFKENIGIMFLGSQGIGKSFTSFAIANRLLSNMVPVIAISTIGLLERIKMTYKRYGDEGESEILYQLSNAKLLVLDDLGAENDTPWAKEKLYEIIDTRDRQGKPLIVTTNLTKEQLQNKLIGSDGVNRTYDRLIKMCQPIEVKGTSKRIDEAKRKEEVLRKILY
jgi:DNA replication protein DnaC